MVKIKNKPLKTQNTNNRRKIKEIIKKPLTFKKYVSNLNNMKGQQELSTTLNGEIKMNTQQALNKVQELENSKEEKAVLGREFDAAISAALFLMKVTKGEINPSKDKLNSCLSFVLDNYGSVQAMDERISELEKKLF